MYDARTTVFKVTATTRMTIIDRQSFEEVINQGFFAACQNEFTHSARAINEFINFV